MIQIFIQIIINLILSFVFIYSIHSIWEHLKNTYSVKKTRDLVSIQSKKFQQMMDNIRPAATIETESTNLNKADIEKLNADLEQYINAQFATSDNDSILQNSHKDF